MKTYIKISFNQITEILMQSALGISAVSGCKYILSDMVYALSSMRTELDTSDKEYYIAIRELGVENGSKDYCLERSKGLGYPLVIAKIEKDKVCDYCMTITFTHGWADKDNNYMEQEFNSL